MAARPSVFTSVRAKLFALVALTGGSALVTLAVLAWLMQSQLVELVNGRMPSVVAGLELELRDDLRDVEGSVHALDDAERVLRGLRDGDRDAIVAELDAVYAHHPSVEVAVFGADGALVAQRGLGGAPRRLSEIDGLPALGPSGDAVASGVVMHGCEPERFDASPAYVVLRRVRDLGVAMACLPFDDHFVEVAATKLGAHLAVLEPGRARPRAHTADFPADVDALGAGELALLDLEGGRTFAVARVDLDDLLGDSGLRFVTALDVTDVKRIVRQDIASAAAIIGILALLVVLLGARLAERMAGALAKVSAAMRRVEREEYVHVTGVHTGDELEELAQGFNGMVDGLRERDKLRTTFGKYMTHSVMEHLLAGKVHLGGETLRVTVFFMDIRSFTSMSETMDAQSLVSLLNEYFTEMVTIIMQEEGVVDKYIGDAIMAIFGAPVPRDEDATRALRAAVRMREALVELNARLAERGLPAIEVGIGIHTGEVVAGNIGSEARMEYTVIGDAVNVAARLESATKELGTDIVFSEATRAEIGADFDVFELGEIHVKGRQEPVRTYGVRAWSAAETISANV